jgi:hypothetical protein
MPSTNISALAVCYRGRTRADRMKSDPTTALCASTRTNDRTNASRRYRVRGIGRRTRSIAKPRPVYPISTLAIASHGLAKESCQPHRHKAGRKREKPGWARTSLVVASDASLPNSMPPGRWQPTKEWTCTLGLHRQADRDVRLSLKAKHPTASEQSCSVIQRIAENGPKYGLGPQQSTVARDSAGGT